MSGNKENYVRFTISIPNELNETIERICTSTGKKKSDVVTECLTQFMPMTEKILEMLYSKDADKQLNMLTKFMEFSANGMKQEDNRELIKKEFEHFNENK